MKIGIALSGGGTRGIAHLGIIKALTENGISIDEISGVSAGAIAGAFIASGYQPEEVLGIILKTRLFKFLRPGISQTGILKLEQIEGLLKQYLKESTFENLKIPLTISALNLKTGRVNYFNSGNLIAPILASSSIPLIFNPITINGIQYIDGGLAENLPIAPLRSSVDFIIAAHTNPINQDYEKLTIRTYIERLLLITINNNAQHTLKEVNYVIEPLELRNIRWSDYSKAQHIFDIGYEYTQTILPELKEKIKANQGRDK